MVNKVTLRDIALRAGVGDGTVSRVLNNHPNVSQKTRDKVMKVVEELDYRPNFSARHMRTQRSHLIGFLTDLVATTPFAGQIIQGAQEAAWGEGHILMIVNTEDDPALTQAAIDVFLERDVEAIVYAAMWHRAVSLPASVRKVPVALANCFSAEGDLSSVVPDEERGGREATERLIAAGHRRIGFINFALNPDVPASVGREAGYQAALAAHDLPFNPALIYRSEDDATRGYSGTIALLNLPDPPTALFCINDRTAMGAYNAAHALGRRIPDDLAIIGFDDQTVITEGLRPTLTSVALPHREMGRWAVEEVFRLIGGEEMRRQERMPCPIRARESG
jgi:LacI family transcriptional regulator